MNLEIGLYWAGEKITIQRTVNTLEEFDKVVSRIRDEAIEFTKHSKPTVYTHKGWDDDEDSSSDDDDLPF